MRQRERGGDEPEFAAVSHAGERGEGAEPEDDEAETERDEPRLRGQARGVGGQRQER